MKKSRKKRGGAIPAMETLITLWNQIDKGNFSYISHPSLYKKEFVINMEDEIIKNTLVKGSN